MRQTAKTLYQFVSGFGIPAYTTENIPDSAVLPYLTYPIVQPEWNQKATLYIQGWYRTNSYTEMMAKCDEILREIGTGIILSNGDGYVVIYPETPLVQFLTDSDNGTRSFYINLSINSYQMPGV